MKSIQISEYRKQLSKYHKMVLENHDPILIKVAGDDDVVILPREDFENLQETIYILKDKTTMASLFEGRIRALEKGNSTQYKDMNTVFSDAMED